MSEKIFPILRKYLGLCSTYAENNQQKCEEELEIVCIKLKTIKRSIVV